MDIEKTIIFSTEPDHTDLDGGSSIMQLTLLMGYRKIVLVLAIKAIIRGCLDLEVKGFQDAQN